MNTIKKTNQHYKILKTILACIFYTEVCIVGTFTMLSFAWTFEQGFMIWGFVIFLMCAMLLKFGGFDNPPNPIIIVAFLNAIGVNFGGYLALMLILRIPIYGVVYF